MKEGLERKTNKFPETGSGIPVLRKGRNESFQVGHFIGWCPDHVVSKFHIPMTNAPHIHFTITCKVPYSHISFNHT